MLDVTRISNALSSPLSRVAASGAGLFFPSSNFILSLASTASWLILHADEVALQLASRRFTETTPNIPPKPAHESDRPFSWVEPSLDVKDIDPALMISTFGRRLVNQMFESLTALDLDGRPTAGAAERWAASDDKMTWVFYLRRDARWSNGDPVTASDFRTAYARALNPLSEGAAIDDLGLIKNAMAFKTRKITDFNDVGVRVVDDYTLELRLEHPEPAFPLIVSDAVYAPAPTKVIKKHKNDWIKPEHIAVNGPYKLIQWKYRVELVLEKNPYYWAHDSVQIKRLIVHQTEDPQTALTLYRSGKTDWSGEQFPPALVQSSRERSDFHQAPRSCAEYLSLRMDRQPFNDPRVRKAVSFAIDRESFVKSLFRSGVPIYHFIPEELLKHDGITTPEDKSFDPNMARALLAQAGYAGGDNLPVIELICSAGEQMLMAEFIENQLERNLGLPKEKVITTNLDPNMRIAKMEKGDFQAGTIGNCVGMRGAAALFEGLYSGSPYNMGGYKSTAYDGLLSRMQAAPSLEDRKSAMFDAERLLQEDVPVVTIYQSATSYLLKPGVENFRLENGLYFNAKYLRYGPPIAE